MGGIDDDLDDDALEPTRTALNPMLDAMASILPWVSQNQPARFPPEVNKRWIEASQVFAEHWQTQAASDPAEFRRLTYRLLEIALATGDPDCLHLGEALASVADHLDQNPPGPRLRAALTALCETLQENETPPKGLEHPHLSERLRHFQQRLATALRPSDKPGERSDVLDRLFITDAEERLAHMRDALNSLPIDVYALAEEATGLIEQAEEIEMWGIYHLARDVQNHVLQLSDASETAQDAAAAHIENQLKLIAASLREIER